MLHHRLIPCLAALCILCAPALAYNDDELLPRLPPLKLSDLRVPEGFIVEQVAAPPLVEHPTLACFDCEGRLYVCDGTGANLAAEDLLRELPARIVCLEDRDGDGQFDQRTVFADKLTFPTGVVWHNGSIYTASPPNIWRLTDTDGDRVADRREIVVSEFGFNGNATDLHGCYLGPDGMLYWTHGRHEHKIVDPQGKIISQGQAARVFRCRPDGSQVEVFAGGGMDNPVEICFTEAGELIGTVDTFDVVDGRHDALVHWVYGGVYPRYDERSVEEFRRTGDLLPAILRFGQVAPSGVMRYRGVQFGPDYANNIFITEFNTRNVTRVKLERAGATFTGKPEPFLTCDHPDFHPTDVLEDADGSLLVIDTGGWFRIGCTTSRIARPEVTGGIYRISRRIAPNSDDWRGTRYAWHSDSIDTLVQRLAANRPVVVDRAQAELVSRGNAAVPALQTFVESSKSTAARQRAVWTLARIDTPEARAALRNGLRSEDAAIVQTSATALGLLRDEEAVDDLIVCLQSANDSGVVRELATALGRIGNVKGVPPLLATANVRNDWFIQHALIDALIEINQPELTMTALGDAHPSVQRVVLIALDQMADSKLTPAQVVKLIESGPVATNPNGSATSPLYAAAIDVLRRRPGWSDEVRALIERSLTAEKTGPSRRQVIVNVLPAFCRNLEIQDLVAQHLANSKTSAVTQVTLLMAIVRCELDPFPRRWRDAVAKVLGEDDPKLLNPALDVVAARSSVDFNQSLTALAERDGLPEELRLRAWTLLAQRGQPLADVGFALLMAQLDGKRAAVERLEVAQALGAAMLSDEQREKLCSALAVAGPLELPALCLAFERPLSADLAGKLLKAIEQSPGREALAAHFWQRLAEMLPEELRPTARQHLARLEKSAAAQREQLAKLAGQLDGGNARRGQEIFYGATAACSACHRVDGRGGTIGPDLSQIGKIRSPIDLLEALVVPSASLVRGYESYSVITREGKSYLGVISRQTPEAIYLRSADRSEVRVFRNDIDQLARSPQSIMPQGIDRSLSGIEIRDLIAYLQSLRN